MGLLDQAAGVASSTRSAPRSGDLRSVGKLPSADPVFGRGRTIADGDAIPRINRHEDIQLIRTDAADPAELRSAGCRLAASGWWAPRQRDFPFEALASVLPRYARRTVVPEVVDLIPATSWHASLANLLTKTSWDRLRGPAAAAVGGCEDCGVKSGLECHESWSYDEDRGVQTLVRLRTLCSSCHETCHLGFARIQGRFEQAFRRLTLINRIRDDEMAAYHAAVETAFLRRSRMAWALDLSILAGSTHSLIGRMEQVADGVVAGPTRGGSMVEVPLIGVTIGRAARTLTIQ